MEAEQLSPLAVTHLLQHTLRSLCIHENSQWVYAVFWRILPRNYPPPKWEGHGAYDRSRGNRRNWILVWEDGFCNFGASTTALEMNSGAGAGGAGGHDHHQCSGSGSGSGSGAANSSVYGNSSCDHQFQQYQGLQPELFFKMSHEIYNYGEGLIGKVAADHGHKWIYKEPNDQEINFLSAWHNSADSYPRTWEAQFQSGIKTIALIAVREGVVQLGSIHKVIEDLSYVVLLRKKFSYIESIPGVLLPHPSSSPVYPFKVVDNNYGITPDAWHFQGLLPQTHHNNDYYDHQYNHSYSNNNNDQPLMKNIITPSMSSLEALLSKLPSVVPPPPHVAAGAGQTGGGCFSQFQRPTTPLEFDHMGMEKIIAKDEIDDDHQEGEDNYRPEIRDHHAGESSSSMSMSGFRQQQHHYFHHHQDHHSLARSTGPNNSGF